MAIYFITERRDLIEKLAEIVDRAEGYHVDVRRPGYVTQRHANIDTKPDGTEYAYSNDPIVAKYFSALGDELAKYGVSKATATKAIQDTQTGTKPSDTIALTSGAYAGVTIALQAKSADWTPVEAAMDAKLDAQAEVKG